MNLGNVHGVALILADAKGFIRDWNKGAEEIFGHKAADAIGQRVDIIVPHDLRDMHWAGFNRTIKTNWRGGTEWGGLEALHASGKLIAVEVLLTGLPSATGGLEGVLALFRLQAS